MESFGKEQVLLNAAQVALQLAQSITYTSIPVILKIIIYNFSDYTLLLVSGPNCSFSLLFSTDSSTNKLNRPSMAYPAASTKASARLNFISLWLLLIHSVLIIKASAYIQSIFLTFLWSTVIEQWYSYHLHLYHSILAHHMKLRKMVK